MSQSDFESRRQFLISALTATAVTAGGILVPSKESYAMGKIPKQLVPGKSIYELKGPVFVDGQPATESTKINPTSLVETGSNAFVVFVVGSDAHILRENSRVQFSGDAIVNTMRIITGKLLSVFGHRQKTQKSLSLTTSTATIGIRGTGVYTEADEDKTYICTCYGHTVIGSNTNPDEGEDVISMHHDAPRFVLANAEYGKHIIPAPVFNHDDEELMLVEALVGRKPPFTNVTGYNKIKNY